HMDRAAVEARRPERDLAPRGNDAGERPDEAGFARAIWADERDHLAGLDVERDVAADDERAVARAQGPRDETACVMRRHVALLGRRLSRADHRRRRRAYLRRRPRR